MPLSPSFHRIALLCLYLLGPINVLAEQSSKREEQASATPSDSSQTALEQRLDLVERWLDAKCAYDEIPGISVAVVKSGDVIWTHGEGVVNSTTKAPMQSDSIFCIASISKLFTSVALLQLRDAGKLRLDDEVSKYLPWFQIRQHHAEGGPITIRSLLTHSSGLPREGELAYWNPDSEFPDLEQLKDTVSGQHTLYAHQEKFQYSNLGLSIAGAVVEAVSGQSFSNYVSARILDPLEMKDTFMARPEGEPAKRIATGYSGKSRTGERFAIEFQSAGALTPAAGMWSTSEDLAKFAAWQMRCLSDEDDKILKPTTLREMQRVHWIEGDWGWARGLGFFIDKMGDGLFVGHGGHCPGHKSQIWLQPEEELAVIAMANTSAANASGMATVILRGLREVLRSEERREEEVEAFAAERKELLGTYTRAKRGGEILLLNWDGSLATVFLPSSDPFDSVTSFEEVEEDSYRSRSDDKWTGRLLFFQRNEKGDVTGMLRSGNLWSKNAE